MEKCFSRLYYGDSAVEAVLLFSMVLPSMVMGNGSSAMGMDKNGTSGPNIPETPGAFAHV